MAEKKKISDINAEIAGTKKLMKERVAEYAAMDKYKGLSEDQLLLEVKKDEQYKKHISKIKYLNTLKQAELASQKAIVDSLISAERSAKGLSGIYSNMGNIEKQRLVLQREIADIDPERADTLNRIADLNQDLSKLDKDDVVTKSIILDKIKQENASLGVIAGNEKEIVDLLKQQTEEATGLSNLSGEQKEQLEAQVKAYEGIKKGIGGVLATAGLLFSGFRGFARITLLGAGKAITELGKTTREFGGFLGGATVSATALGFVFKDAAGTAKALSAEMGGLNDVSFKSQLNTNLLATNMGISGQEAAKLTGNFARLNGGSIQSAQNMAAATKELAKQNGLVPSQVMADVAASAEEFAVYGKDGGKNIGEAAVAAAKLGVNMSSLTKVTDNLLDFENSINNELELGAMLGKNIQLDRARALAYEGNIGGAVKETLNSLGGIEEFNKMDIFQKRKAAELLGLSVDEFQKMAANQDKLNEDGSIQLSTFDTLWESATAIATGPLASMVSTLGTGITLAGQLGTGFQAIGGPLKDMASSVWSWVSGLIKGKAAQTALGATGGASQFAGGSFSAGKQMLAQRAAGATPAAAATPAPGAGGQAAGDMNKMGKINGKALIQGAAAMLIMAAALYVMAKALQQFKDVGVEELGMAAGSLIVLGGALIGLSYALAPLAASGILFMVAAGMLALGGAVFLVGAGFKLFSEGVATLGGVLPSMVEPLSQLSQINFLPIIGLAASLGLLAVALAAVAVSGLLALPILAGLGLIAGGVAAVAGGGEGEGDSKTDELIAEIKGLRTDLNSGKIAVNIDGQKVTSNIGKVVSRLSTNSYAKT